MILTTYVTSRARVYRFGTRWHWNCGRGQCLGGPKRTQTDALTAAFNHVHDEHLRVIRVLADETSEGE